MNQLFYGDNLPILRHHVKTESVDLIYLDPPFNSNASHYLKIVLDRVFGKEHFRREIIWSLETVSGFKSWPSC